MIPDKYDESYKKAKFSILEHGNIIEQTDEYYNPIKDKWLPVMAEFVGQEWDSDYSKPVRREIKK